MNAFIRDAIPEDVTAILQLIQELANFEKEPHAVSINEETLLLNGFGESPLFHCFVAEVEHVIVGIALVYYRFSTWKGKTLHLEDLIVKQAYRNKGIGTLLFNNVIHYANKKEVKRVEWVVLDWNKNAINFYNKTGANLLKNWYLVQLEGNNLKNFT